MEYRDLIGDFAARTRRNLELIERQSGDEAEKYEVTQLVNSLLGLLVFPQQRYFERIPETALSNLVAKGWPEVKATFGALPADNLKQLVRYLRNAISHFNIEFVNRDGRIAGLRVWNKPPGREIDWRAELSVCDLRILVMRFANLVGEISDAQREHGGTGE